MLAMLTIAACASVEPPPSASPTPTLAPRAGTSVPQPADQLVRDLLALIPGGEVRYLERLAACLRSQGWDAEVIEDGQALRFSYFVEANREAYEASKRACDVAVPPPPVEPLPDDGIRAVFAHWVAMRGCLAGLGNATSEPPSEQTFLGEWKANGDIWSPYLDLPIHGLEATEDACPQQAPGVR
jgi:hypothetical protein